ncbi:MAG TPA: response regulator [Streptosporangiaceae bacterium]
MAAMPAAVLYIDDSEDNLRLVARIISRYRADTELLTAGTGQDGLRAAIESRPGLILLDNRLPDATGAEVLQQLASTGVTAQIPVVILSGDSGQSTVEQLLGSGAAGFLAKPFSVAELVATLDRFL